MEDLSNYHFPSTKQRYKSVCRAYRQYLQRIDTLTKEGFGESLHYYYRKPSEAKQQVWHHWQGRLSNIAIIAHNAQRITLGGIIEHEGTRYFAYITPSNNYILEI